MIRHVIFLLVFTQVIVDTALAAIAACLSASASCFASAASIASFFALIRIAAASSLANVALCNSEAALARSAIAAANSLCKTIFISEFSKSWASSFVRKDATIRSSVSKDFLRSAASDNSFSSLAFSSAVASVEPFGNVEGDVEGDGIGKGEGVGVLVDGAPGAGSGVGEGVMLGALGDEFGFGAIETVFSL